MWTIRHDASRSRRGVEFCCVIDSLGLVLGCTRMIRFYVWNMNILAILFNRYTRTHTTRGHNQTNKCTPTFNTEETLRAIQKTYIPRHIYNKNNTPWIVSIQSNSIRTIQIIRRLTQMLHNPNNIYHVIFNYFFSFKCRFKLTYPITDKLTKNAHTVKQHEHTHITETGTSGFDQLQTW